MSAKPLATEARPPRNGAAQALKAAKQALSRDHILDVAEKVFAEHGFAGTRMQDIAREAGISLATLYQFHPGKQELHHAVLVTRDREMLDAVMARLQSVSLAQAPLTGLLWMMKVNVAFLLNHPDYLRLILQEGYMWYHAAAQPSRDEQALWELGAGLIEQALDFGVRAGQLVEGKGRDQARMLMALQQTRLANWVAGGMAEDHAIVIARVQTDFLRLFALPRVAVEMVTPDGTALTSAVQAQLAALDTATR
ncbi:TetR/AcrR family transcriptional regulator [Zavarzinia sp.]|uniref:TetR/AcrR family transcriptional regulator n=1 Tax=Zavarzinia sp. TaxID=2027920 RepID=UPI003BB75C4D